MPGEECEGEGGAPGPDDPHAATPRTIPVTAMANSTGRTRDDFSGCKPMLGPSGDNIIACATPARTSLLPAAIPVDPQGRYFQAGDCAGHPECIMSAGGQARFCEQDGGIAA